MAQALFDEHPLEQYLRNAGEVQNTIPGSTVELESEFDPWWATDFEDGEENNLEWRPPFMIKITEIILAAIPALDLPSLFNQSSPFVERFKYDVISSTLLAVSLPSAYARTSQSLLPDLPGQLNHSQTSTASLDISTPLAVTLHESSYLIPFFVLVAFGFFIHAGYYVLALAPLGITVYFVNASYASKHDMSPSMESLNELILSNNEWEKVVQAALDIVDSDEPSVLYGAATPPSSSALRIALHTTLLTTQTQCDNVRQLFSALTSPSELSQLCEMYAPPSPTTSSFSPERTRLLSLPSHRRTLSMPSDPFLSKRANRQNWSGTYSRLGQLNSSTSRRVKRTFNLSSVTSGSPLATASAPVTPSYLSVPPANEESDSEYEDAYEQVPHTADGALTFGAAALALHRERKTDGMDTFGLSPASHSSPVPSRFTPRSPRSPRTPPRTSSTYHSGSRLTPVQVARHPLSLSALHHALQSALASKRFACSHLLALRFTDEDDDGYWEDVRSVMGLLTITLVDASVRLSEAITEIEQQRLRDQNPTPSSLKDFPCDSDNVMASPISPSSPLSDRRNRSISFAPLPSHLSRFATHVEAIQSALDDAKENLQQCVAALREREETVANSGVLDGRLRRRTRPTSISSSADVSPAPPPPPISPAIEAYERLRRELGFALRECERGRERLLDVVYPPDMFSPEDEAHSSDDVPALGHDGSDESDKPDSSFSFDIEQESPPQGYAVVALEGVDGGVMDDATSHLLLSTSTQYLPPPGIEQVFEADTGSVGAFNRERSKLTREERIKLVKAKRESKGAMLGLGLSTSQEMERRGGTEKWGPGGEVVQELKDVIWKVGERRRRMADTNSSKVIGVATSSEPVQLDETQI
ncbi:hypothetical protein C0992_013250 [Termitomyces sp. T32_za158]|nr:hypothetical protein C0992_013250 [Termitomyces sp. T32_za158]